MILVEAMGIEPTSETHALWASPSAACDCSRRTPRTGTFRSIENP